MNLDESLIYQCRSKLLPARNYAAVYKVARKIFNRVSSQTKRRPYIRSAYFRKEKIFLDNFWAHLNQKSPADRARRLKLLNGGIEVIQKSNKDPIKEKSNQQKAEQYYRFFGQIDKVVFAVQIKEDLKRNQKYLMSMFEYKK